MHRMKSVLDLIWSFTVWVSVSNSHHCTHSTIYIQHACKNILLYTIYHCIRSYCCGVVEPMRCYGDKYIQCSKGMSCVLEQGTPKCQGRQLVILNMYVGSLFTGYGLYIEF